MERPGDTTSPHSTHTFSFPTGHPSTALSGSAGNVPSGSTPSLSSSTPSQFKPLAPLASFKPLPSLKPLAPFAPLSAPSSATSSAGVSVSTPSTEQKTDSHDATLENAAAVPITRAPIASTAVEHTSTVQYPPVSAESLSPVETTDMAYRNTDLSEHPLFCSPSSSMTASSSAVTSATDANPPVFFTAAVSTEEVLVGTEVPSQDASNRSDSNDDVYGEDGDVKEGVANDGQQECGFDSYFGNSTDVYDFSQEYSSQPAVTSTPVYPSGDNALSAQNVDNMHNHNDNAYTHDVNFYNSADNTYNPIDTHGPTHDAPATTVTSTSLSASDSSSMTSAVGADSMVTATESPLVDVPLTDTQDVTEAQDMPPAAYHTHDASHQYQDAMHVAQDAAYNPQNAVYGDRNAGYSAQDAAYNPVDAEYAQHDTAYGAAETYGVQTTTYQSQDAAYGAQDAVYQSQNTAYGDAVEYASYSSTEVPAHTAVPENGVASENFQYSGNAGEFSQYTHEGTHDYPSESAYPTQDYSYPQYSEAIPHVDATPATEITASALAPESVLVPEAPEAMPESTPASVAASTMTTAPISSPVPLPLPTSIPFTLTLPFSSAAPHAPVPVGSLTATTIPRADKIYNLPPVSLQDMQLFDAPLRQYARLRSDGAHAHAPLHALTGVPKPESELQQAADKHREAVAADEVLFGLMAKAMYLYTGVVSSSSRQDNTGDNCDGTFPLLGKMKGLLAKRATESLLLPSAVGNPVGTPDDNIYHEHASLSAVFSGTEAWEVPAESVHASSAAPAPATVAGAGAGWGGVDVLPYMKTVPCKRNPTPATGTNTTAVGTSTPTLSPQEELAVMHHAQTLFVAGMAREAVLLCVKHRLFAMALQLAMAATAIGTHTNTNIAASTVSASGSSSSVALSAMGASDLLELVLVKAAQATYVDLSPTFVTSVVAAIQTQSSNSSKVAAFGGDIFQKSISSAIATIISEKHDIHPGMTVTPLLYTAITQPLLAVAANIQKYLTSASGSSSSVLPLALHLSSLSLAQPSTPWLLRHWPLALGMLQQALAPHAHTLSTSTSLSWSASSSLAALASIVSSAYSSPYTATIPGSLHSVVPDIGSVQSLPTLAQLSLVSLPNAYTASAYVALGVTDAAYHLRSQGVRCVMALLGYILYTVFRRPFAGLTCLLCAGPSYVYTFAYSRLKHELHVDTSVIEGNTDATVYTTPDALLAFLQSQIPENHQTSQFFAFSDDPAVYPSLPLSPSCELALLYSVLSRVHSVSARVRHLEAVAVYKLLAEDAAEHDTGMGINADMGTGIGVGMGMGVEVGTDVSVGEIMGILAHTTVVAGTSTIVTIPPCRPSQPDDNTMGYAHLKRMLLLHTLSVLTCTPLPTVDGNVDNYATTVTNTHIVPETVVQAVSTFVNDVKVASEQLSTEATTTFTNVFASAAQYAQGAYQQLSASLPVTSHANASTNTNAVPAATAAATATAAAAAPMAVPVDATATMTTYQRAAMRGYPAAAAYVNANATDTATASYPSAASTAAYSAPAGGIYGVSGIQDTAAGPTTYNTTNTSTSANDSASTGAGAGQGVGVSLGLTAKSVGGVFTNMLGLLDRGIEKLDQKLNTLVGHTDVDNVSNSADNVYKKADDNVYNRVDTAPTSTPTISATPIPTHTSAAPSSSLPLHSTPSASSPSQPQPAHARPMPALSPLAPSPMQSQALSNNSTHAQAYTPSQSQTYAQPHTQSLAPPSAPYAANNAPYAASPQQYAADASYTASQAPSAASALQSTPSLTHSATHSATHSLTPPLSHTPSSSSPSSHVHPYPHTHAPTYTHSLSQQDMSRAVSGTPHTVNPFPIVTPANATAPFAASGMTAGVGIGMPGSQPPPPSYALPVDNSYPYGDNNYKPVDKYPSPYNMSSYGNTTPMHTSPHASQAHSHAGPSLSQSLPASASYNQHYSTPSTSTTSTNVSAPATNTSITTSDLTQTTTAVLGTLKSAVSSSVSSFLSRFQPVRREVDMTQDSDFYYDEARGEWVDRMEGQKTSDAGTGMGSQALLPPPSVTDTPSAGVNPFQQTYQAHLSPQHAHPAHQQHTFPHQSYPSAHSGYPPHANAPPTGYPAPTESGGGSLLPPPPPAAGTLPPTPNGANPNMYALNDRGGVSSRYVSMF